MTVSLGCVATLLNGNCRYRTPKRRGRVAPRARGRDSSMPDPISHVSNARLGAKRSCWARDQERRTAVEDRLSPGAGVRRNPPLRLTGGRTDPALRVPLVIARSPSTRAAAARSLALVGGSTTPAETPGPGKAR